MKKIAVIFPGVAYGCDKPLLYYSADFFMRQGYDVVRIDYDSKDTDWLKKWNELTEAKKHDETLKLLAKTVQEVEEQLKRFPLETYDQVLMVGKGSGAVVGSVYMHKHQINAKCVLITPMEICFQFLSCRDGVAFVGAKDDLADAKQIVEECKARDIKYHVFEEADHSLEGQTLEDNIRYLTCYVQMLEDFHNSFYENAYSFEVEGLDHVIVPLSDYYGKVSLIVNTATGCGFTPQYEQLEQLYKDYKGHGFTILDFPCNQFNNQASGSNEEIHNFCTARYHISFPQFAKVKVNGEQAIPLYGYLKKKCGFHGFDLSTPDGKYLGRKVAEMDADYANNSEIKWNFTKFLVGTDGKVLKRYEVTEDLDIIRRDVELLLGIRSE